MVGKAGFVPAISASQTQRLDWTRLLPDYFNQDGSIQLNCSQSFLIDRPEAALE